MTARTRDPIEALKPRIFADDKMIIGRERSHFRPGSSHAGIGQRGEPARGFGCDALQFGVIGYFPCSGVTFTVSRRSSATATLSTEAVIFPNHP